MPVTEGRGADIVDMKTAAVFAARDHARDSTRL